MSNEVAKARCPICGHYGKVDKDGICRELGTVPTWGGEAVTTCDCKCVFTPVANSEAEHELGLIKEIAKQGKKEIGAIDVDRLGPEVAAKRILDVCSRVLKRIAHPIRLVSPDAAPSPESEVSEPKDDDDLHRWEIEPHPYDSSYDIMITDSDKAAAEAIQYAAEMHLWDGIEEGETRTLKVTLNNVPNADPADTAAPASVGDAGTDERCPACGQVKCFDQALRTMATPSPSTDAEKEARKTFEDIAHLARERVNVPASEVYALLEHIDRRVKAALADLSARSERLDDKGDPEAERAAREIVMQYKPPAGRQPIVFDEDGLTLQGKLLIEDIAAAISYRRSGQQRWNAMRDAETGIEE